MAKWQTVVTWEIKTIGGALLYFLFYFGIGIILTLKKLFLADYQIKVQVLPTTVVSALIAAKIVVTLNHTRAGTRFDASRQLAVAVSYKTPIYALVAFGSLLAETLFHTYGEAGTFERVIADVWVHRDRNGILAKMICVALALAGCHLYAGIDRRLGEGTLSSMLRSRSHSPPASMDHGRRTGARAAARRK